MISRIVRRQPRQTRPSGESVQTWMHGEGTMQGDEARSGIIPAQRTAPVRPARPGVPRATWAAVRAGVPRGTPGDINDLERKDPS